MICLNAYLHILENSYFTVNGNNTKNLCDKNTVEKYLLNFTLWLFLLLKLKCQAFRSFEITVNCLELLAQSRYLAASEFPSIRSFSLNYFILIECALGWVLVVDTKVSPTGHLKSRQRKWVTIFQNWVASLLNFDLYY